MQFGVNLHIEFEGRVLRGQRSADVSSVNLRSGREETDVTEKHFCLRPL